MAIHPTAIVNRSAELGRDVDIGPYCVVGAHVAIGDGCRLHHGVTLTGHTTIGPRCEIYPQAVLGLPPQDLKFEGEKTRLEIGAENIFREMVTIHPGTANGGGITRIGNRNFFLIGVHVAHDCRVGDRCILANYVQLAGHVHLEDQVNIGGQTGVHHFVTIGRHAFVGGMTRVAADVPPYVVMVAARGTKSEVRMINGVGLQRSGFSHADITALKNAFMKLYSRKARLSGVSMRERVEALLAQPSLNPHVEYLCQSLMRSFAHGRHGRYLESLRKDNVHRRSWKVSAKHTLTVQIIGKGSVRRGGNGSTDDADVLELTAQADPGWVFSGWNDGLDGSSNPARLVLNCDKTVAAHFTPAGA